MLSVFLLLSHIWNDHFWQRRLPKFHCSWKLAFMRIFNCIFNASSEHYSQSCEGFCQLESFSTVPFILTSVGILSKQLCTLITNQRILYSPCRWKKPKYRRNNSVCSLISPVRCENSCHSMPNFFVKSYLDEILLYWTDSHNHTF